MLIHIRFQFRDWLRREYKDNPFNDEEHICNLLAQASGNSAGTEGKSMNT